MSTQPLSGKTTKETTDYQVAIPLLPKRARGILLGIFAGLSIIGFFLPGVAIIARPPTYRWLPGTAMSFFSVTSDKLTGVNNQTIGFGFFVTFLGLTMWVLGFMITMISGWILASADLNGFLWIFLLVGALLLGFSVPTVVAGKVFMDAAGAPTTLGLAWIPALISGIGIMVWTLHGRKFIERTSYDVRPELIT